MLGADSIASYDSMATERVTIEYPRNGASSAYSAGPAFIPIMLRCHYAEIGSLRNGTSIGTR